MIIRLKKADFSKNNIGVLNKWYIKNQTSGMTLTLSASSIDKDDTTTAITGTLTVKSGYTLTEAVQITMDGVDKTSWYNSSTGAITIPAGSITATVYITGKAVSESGEEDDGSTIDITNQFELQPNYMISKCTSEGAFTAYDGSWVANENYVDISNYSEIKIKMSKTSAAGTNTGISFYDASQKCVAGYAHTLGDNQYGIMERTFKRVANPQADQTISQEIIEIPETAVYVRTTYWNTAAGTANYQTSFGEFYCKATPKAVG